MIWMPVSHNNHEKLSIQMNMPSIQPSELCNQNDMRNTLSLTQNQCWATFTAKYTCTAREQMEESLWDWVSEVHATSAQ